jgi:hypothetical protein
MADGIVQVQPDSTGKIVDTSSLTVGGNTVQRQRVIWADPTNAAGLTAVVNSAPAGTEYGPVVRPVLLADTSSGTTAPSRFLTVGGKTNDGTPQYQMLPLGAAGRSVIVEGFSGGTGIPVTGTFWQGTQPVSGTFWQATQPVSGTFWQATQPVSGTVTANAGTGTFTTSDGNAASQGSTTSGQKGFLELGAVTTAAPTYTTGQSSPLSLTTGGLLRVDGSGVTQPVNVSQWIGSAAPTVGQKTMANSIPVVLPSDQNVDVTPAAPVATDYLPVRLTDGTNFVSNPATYHLYQMPRVTTAAATDLFDLFNASGSGKTMRVVGIYPVINVTAASAIVPSFEFSVIKTSAVGTGGTGHTFEGAAAPATGLINISRVDDGDATLPAQVTARAIPTGGATASKFMFDVWLLTEETNSATYQLQGINFVPLGQEMKEIVIPQGQGIKIRQITPTASTGTNFGWLIVFTLV